MKTYDQICAEINYNRRETPPEIKYHWIGYDKGNVIPCNSKIEAMNYTLHEKVATQESKDAHDKFFEHRRELESRAFSIFETELRKEYDYLSDEMYSVCYNEAYDRGHHAGHDEVANVMIGVVDFAEQIKKCK